MNAILMPDWMANIKAKQNTALLKGTMENQANTLGNALIRSEAFNTWKIFVRELAIQAEVCQQLHGIGTASLVPVGEGENAEKEYRLTICGSGPLAVARICVVRFCQRGDVGPDILCICQDWLRDDFHIKFVVDEKGTVCLLTDTIANPIEAASYVIRPVISSFTERFS